MLRKRTPSGLHLEERPERRVTRKTGSVSTTQRLSFVLVLYLGQLFPGPPFSFLRSSSEGRMFETVGDVRN